MIKAICKNEEGWCGDDGEEDKEYPGPIFNEKVTIIGFYIEVGKVYFYLQEYPPTDQRDGYLSETFVCLEKIKYPSI